MARAKQTARKSIDEPVRPATPLTPTRAGSVDANSTPSQAAPANNPDDSSAPHREEPEQPPAGVSYGRPATPLSSYSSSGLASQVIDEKYKRDRAWKYEGYRAFTQWLDSSNDFFMIRRFGALNARAVLLMQDRIVQKEAELEKLDREVMEAHGDDDARNYSLRWDEGTRREQLMDEIISLLQQYNEFITTLSGIKARSSASDGQIANMTTWFTNHPNAIRNDQTSNGINEQEFIHWRGDVIPLVAKSKSPIRDILERVSALRLAKVFRAQYRRGPPIGQDQNGDAEGVTETKNTEVTGVGRATVLTSDRGFEWFVTIATICTGLALLFGPMWWLQFEPRAVSRLGIITGFVSLFTVLLTLSTVPRPFEVLAATAAYAAVLMVFLQVRPG